MVLKFSLLVLLAAASTYGAVIPMEEDALFDMVQSFLTSPDQFADALGMTRVKRSTYDREFNVAAIGAHIGIKFSDPNNRLKGGSADVTIDNLKKFVKQAKSTKVVLKIKFDSGKSPKDGLFSMSVNYELHHKMVEKGSFSVNRQKVGDKWSTQIDSKKDSKAPDQIIPGFSLSMKSDYKTTGDGVYSCDHGHKYSININRVPGKKIHAVIKGNNKVYTIDGVLDQAGKNIDIVINADGKIIKATGQLEVKAKTYDVTVKAKYGKTDYTVEMTAQKDYKMAGLSVKMGDNVITSVELAGDMKAVREGNKIVEIKNMKYLASVNIMGLDKIELKYGMSNGKKQMHKFVMEMKGMDKIEAGYTRKLKENYGRDVKLVIKRGGETYIEYNNQFTPSSTPDHYIIDVQSKFDVNKKSKTYKFFCTYGCFTTRSMHSNVKINKKTPYKFNVDVSLTKDALSVLELKINTVKNPYVFTLNAPRLLPKLLPTGRKSIEFTADHKPGSYLKVNSNTDIIKSFYVEKQANGMRKVSLNGKELVKAAFSQGDNTITQTTKLPNGMEATTTISWAKDDMKANEVDVKLDATNRHMNAKLRWDVNNMANIKMFFDVEGSNPKMGKYHISRDMHMSSVGNELTADWTGTTSVDNAPWPSPIDTKVHAAINTVTNDYIFDIAKTIAGAPYGITMKNGRLSVNL